MKLSELVAYINNVKPSEYTVDEITQWINEVEFMAVDQVFEKAFGPIAYRAYRYFEDADTELAIPDQFNGVYTSYVFHKIDFNNAEDARSNAEAISFDSEWQAFASYYRRKYKPRRKHEITHHRHGSF